MSYFKSRYENHFFYKSILEAYQARPKKWNHETSHFHGISVREVLVTFRPDLTGVPAKLFTHVSVEQLLVQTRINKENRGMPLRIPSFFL